MIAECAVLESQWMPNGNTGDNFCFRPDVSARFLIRRIACLTGSQRWKQEQSQKYADLSGFHISLHASSKCLPHGLRVNTGPAIKNAKLTEESAQVEVFSSAKIRSREQRAGLSSRRIAFNNPSFQEKQRVIESPDLLEDSMTR
jgi:hypothetical protein